MNENKYQRKFSVFCTSPSLSVKKQYGCIIIVISSNVDFCRLQTKLGQGNMFTGVCLSTEGEGVPGPGGVPAPGGVPGPGGVPPQVVCLLWGGCLLPGRCPVETPRDGHCCGRYASY